MNRHNTLIDFPYPLWSVLHTLLSRFPYSLLSFLQSFSLPSSIFLPTLLSLSPYPPQTISLPSSVGSSFLTLLIGSSFPTLLSRFLIFSPYPPESDPDLGLLLTLLGLFSLPSSHLLPTLLSRSSYSLQSDPVFLPTLLNLILGLSFYPS